MLFCSPGPYGEPSAANTCTPPLHPPRHTLKATHTRPSSSHLPFHAQPAPPSTPHPSCYPSHTQRVPDLMSIRSAYGTTKSPTHPLYPSFRSPPRIHASRAPPSPIHPYPLSACASGYHTSLSLCRVRCPPARAMASHPYTHFLSKRLSRRHDADPSGYFNHSSRAFKLQVRESRVRDGARPPLMGLQILTLNMVWPAPSPGANHSESHL